jgi:hypothetical protein
MRSEASRVPSLKVSMPSVDDSLTDSTLYRTVNEEMRPDESTPQTSTPSLRKNGISPGSVAKGITNPNYVAEEEEEDEQVEEKSKL